MDIGQKIVLLRDKANLTQEELAARLNVTRQAVQKWESGAAAPDINSLIALGKYFNITIDELVAVKAVAKTTEELRFSKRYIPDYALMQDENYSNIMTEFRQMSDEGRDVSKYKKLAEEIAALPVGKAREDMADYLLGLMSDAPVCGGYKFYEPDTLAEIKACRKKEASEFNKPVKNDGLRDKIKGAWLGRAAGCLLGKPIEGIRTDDLSYLLKATGNYPLKRYILKSDLTDEIYEKCKFPLKGRCFADTVVSAPADDDTNYTVMYAKKLISDSGRNFTPKDVAKCWLASQPRDAYFTAERIAFVNFLNGYYPPVSAIYKNPCREWIGAQIRADYFGYINPADPETAAEMAWRDASVSHVKNGIYGEMFVAAMLACAAVCDDMKSVIRGGLAQIPQKSRLHAGVTEIIRMYESGAPASDCAAYIHQNYDEHGPHGWCHTIPNALIVATALLYGGMDFGKTVCLAVGCAFDTDCNGATAGSVLGMILGASGLPREWISVFNGKIDTSVLGVGTVSIDELADLTMAHMPKE